MVIYLFTYLFISSEAETGIRSDSGIFDADDNTSKSDKRNFLSPSNPTSSSVGLNRRGGAARKVSLRKSQEFNKSMLMRSWHSIDFKPRRPVTKSRESVRSRRAVSTRGGEMNEVKVVK